jgi:ATP/ADP translocase/HEAT repeat protein
MSEEASGTDRRSLANLGGARPILESFAASVLLVRPREGRRTALCFLHLLLASAVFVMGRTVRDTLFLSRFSLSALPWMFVCYGVASAITVVIYAQVADRMPRDKMIAIWCGLGVVTYLGAWGAVSSGAVWIYPVFYVWSEVFANLLISQFWTLANDLHDARAAKRLFGTIGAARVLGVIAVGMCAGAIVKLIGTAQLLFVLAGLLVVIGWVAILLGREPRPERPRARGAARAGKERGARVIGEPYVNALALMLLVAFMALTLGDYQFKAIARSTYREDDLARFFSFFYAGAGVVSFVFQLLATPRLLARFGVGAGACVMPSVFGAASAVLLLGPSLGVATVMKFADNGLQYTIHETTLQALYVPFAASVKVRTRAFLDAVVKPLAYGAGGGVLLVCAGSLPVERLSWITVGLVAAWLATIPLVKRRYAAKLTATLTARGSLETVGEERIDGAGRAVLVRALGNPDPRIALGAVDELAAEGSPEVQEALARLAAWPEPAIRVAALERIGAHRELSARFAIPLLADEVPEVRIAAVRAAVALGDEVLAALEPLLDDPEAAVRTEALAALLSRCGFEAELRGGARLLALYSSGDPSDRAQAARVLGAVGRGVHGLLRALLGDPDLGVRRAALRAAGAAGDVRLVAPLVEALADSGLRGDAEAALAKMGAAAVAPVAAVLAAQDQVRGLRLVVPRILRRIRAASSYAALADHLEDADSRVRLRVASAMGALRRDLELKPFAAGALAILIDAEIEKTISVQTAWRTARHHFPSPLFDEEMGFRLRGCVRRVLRLLELRYDRATLRLVRESLGDPAKRSNALEVLDSALEPALRNRVMMFLDARETADARPAAGDEDRLSAIDFLLGQCRHANPYVAHLALEALSKKPEARAVAAALELRDDKEPLVREGAVHVLAAAGDDRARRALDDLTRDPDERVAGLARARIAAATGRETTEVGMYSTVEKILLLRSVPLFEKLSGEDLASLARLAVGEVHDPGDVIFKEGDPGDALYVIVRGAVEIRRGADDVITVLEAPDVFGEMAVLDTFPRSATAIAVGGVELLCVGSEEFYEALQERFEVADGVIRLLSRRLRDADQRIADLG